MINSNTGISMEKKCEKNKDNKQIISK